MFRVVRQLLHNVCLISFVAFASNLQLLNIPDTHEVHFFNGGATLQFAAVPLNLMGGENEGKAANYLMSGHWSEKARNEAMQFGTINEVAKDPAGLYFSVPPSAEWNTDRDGAYFHYTSADTRQGLEIRDFEFDAIPEVMPLVCDASANLGSFNMDIAKHDVIYSASHKNFSCSGICYAIIRKDLITRKNQMKVRERKEYGWGTDSLRIFQADDTNTHT